ncbi:MAG: hypothetical protein UW10_C0001G0063 [Candidatus Magasanikbacteria bacterium GW2011_GWA2_43_9]|nr:MAG: hypothetical protein UW10_C0001G0063 [Candidatus Magasanikbacteria bacterium GW2011_GWA2_43_9]
MGGEVHEGRAVRGAVARVLTQSIVAGVARRFAPEDRGEAASRRRAAAVGRAGVVVVARHRSVRAPEERVAAVGGAGVVVVAAQDRARAADACRAGLSGRARVGVEAARSVWDVDHHASVVDGRGGHAVRQVAVGARYRLTGARVRAVLVASTVGAGGAAPLGGGVHAAERRVAAVGGAGLAVVAAERGVRAARGEVAAVGGARVGVVAARGHPVAADAVGAGLAGGTGVAVVAGAAVRDVLDQALVVHGHRRQAVGQVVVLARHGLARAGRAHLVVAAVLVGGAAPLGRGEHAAECRVAAVGGAGLVVVAHDRLARAEVIRAADRRVAGGAAGAVADVAALAGGEVAVAVVVDAIHNLLGEGADARRAYRVHRVGAVEDAHARALLRVVGAIEIAVTDGAERRGVVLDALRLAALGRGSAGLGDQLLEGSSVAVLVDDAVAVQVGNAVEERVVGDRPRGVGRPRASARGEEERHGQEGREQVLHGVS